MPPVPGGPLVGVPPITAPGVPPTTAGSFGVPAGGAAVLGPGTGRDPVAEAFGLGGEGGAAPPACATAAVGRLRARTRAIVVNRVVNRMGCPVRGRGIPQPGFPRKVRAARSGRRSASPSLVPDTGSGTRLLFLRRLPREKAAPFRNAFYR
ncbi:hypothetical protein F8B43_1340 [Methylorubrum populi]|uniref:Uncharacterized protein n=1 Tax=Methylorubrum populi TaxID=223967 RepID=A0A833J7R7_9HYPH|nr:hypothetical protein F8B43_1340 [Methylorubrum populi]